MPLSLFAAFGIAGTKYQGMHKYRKILQVQSRKHVCWLANASLAIAIFDATAHTGYRFLNPRVLSELQCDSMTI
jgi:hypothetical protein